MILAFLAAFLGGVVGAAVGFRYFSPGAWPWERTKQAGADPLIGPAGPRPVMQVRPYDQDEDTPPRGTPPIDPGILEAIKDDVNAELYPHPLDIEERGRKWAERRRISEAKPKPVGL